jgi:enoyl-CoA hydratase/carnithine racemase
MAYEAILYEKSGPVATITLNRPQMINAINPTLEAEMHQALDEADADPEVRAIILTGAGRGFCAGFDVARPRNEGSGDTGLDPGSMDTAEYLRRWWYREVGSHERIMHLWYVGKPIIAAVHGWVMGGGFWYSLAADITIAADNAVFGQPEVRHVSNTTLLFAVLAGWKVAHRYALTGDHLDAQEALRIGIVNEVVPADQLMDRARALAERIAKVPEPSVRLNKAMTCFGLMAMGMGAGMLMGVPLSNLAHGSHNAFRGDLMEAMKSGGMRAFLEMRDGPFRPEPFGPKAKTP